MEVVLRVDAGDGADDEENAELALQLREELGAHDLGPVPRPLAAPAGAKGVGSGEIASLLVVLAASGGVLTSLVGTLQAWLLRHSESRVVVEIDGDRIELTGTTDEERRRALDFWLERHESAREAETGEERRGGDTAS